MQHEIILSMPFFVTFNPQINWHHHSMCVGTHKAFALHWSSDMQSLTVTRSREAQIINAFKRPRHFHTPARNAFYPHAISTVSPFLVSCSRTQLEATSPPAEGIDPPPGSQDSTAWNRLSPLQALQLMSEEPYATTALLRGSRLHSHGGQDSIFGCCGTSSMARCRHPTS